MKFVDFESLHEVYRFVFIITQIQFFFTQKFKHFSDQTFQNRDAPISGRYFERRHFSVLRTHYPANLL